MPSTLARIVVTRSLAPLLLVALFASCRRENVPRFRDRFAVGDGQVALIARMAGAGEVLPGPCALTEVTLERASFEARYRCEASDAPSVIAFRHREDAPSGAEVTAQFTLIPFGARGVPAPLLRAVVARVRAEETAWRWIPYADPGGVRARVAIPLGRTAAPRLPPSVPAELPSPIARAAPPEAAPTRSPAPEAAPTRAPAPEAAPSATAVIAAPTRAPAPEAAPSATAVIAAPPRQITEPRDAETLVERPPPGLELNLLRRDGVLFFALGLAFILALLRRQLRELPRSASFALGAVVLGGAALRWFIARDAPMTAWSYTRVVPLARGIYEGYLGPNLAEALGLTVHLDGLIHGATFVIASLTPLVLFAHARYVLKDWRAALAAAALLALLPLHIRFSRSDVEILQALLTSSFTFVVLYCAMTDDDARWRAACWVALPLLCVATYLARPEAIIFFPLDLGGVLVAWRAAPPRRRWTAVALTSVAAAWSVWTHLLVNYRQNVQEGLSVGTLRNAAALFADPAKNMLINPWAMPLGVSALAAFGAVALWRRGARGRALFLLGWLLSFFVVHSYVVPYARAMQARYHLNLVTPFVLLAAAATPEVLRWPRVAQALLGAYLLAAPFTHLAMERDVDYFEMHELAFLRRARAQIPARCAVLEYMPASDFAGAVTHASRVSRALDHLARGRWVVDGGRRIVPLSELPPEPRGREVIEVLSARAAALLASPPPCLLYYEGLTCASHRPASTRMAPVCEEVRRRVALRPLLRTSTTGHIYDTVNAGPTVRDDDGRARSVMRLREGDAVTFTLYRVAPP